MHDIGVAGDDSWRWRHRGSTPSPEAEVNGIWADALVNHIAERRSDNRPVAFLSAMRADFRNGHCYIAVLADPKFVRSPYAAEAVGLFLVYLMTSFPLRKIYFETPAFNAEQFAPALSQLCVTEGCLTEYEYHDGRYWDYIIASISRSVIADRVATLVGHSGRVPADIETHNV